MEPANPPLPTPRYFPFQPAAGSQTSNSMCESADGVSVACTRQNAGKRSNAVKISADGRRSPARKWNAPGATSLALVIVVLGSVSLAKLSHGAALAIDDTAIRSAGT